MNLTNTTCVYAKGITSCNECRQKRECNIYALIMDLTAIRDKCPLDNTKECCPKYEDVNVAPTSDEEEEPKTPEW